jgi:hypothetical protein
MFFFLKTDTINIVINLIIFNLKQTELEMTPSLASFVSSLVAGGFVVLVIAVALVIISKSDRVTRY